MYNDPTWNENADTWKWQREKRLCKGDTRHWKDIPQGNKRIKY